jgi:hypothetical protein
LLPGAESIDQGSSRCYDQAHAQKIEALTIDVSIFWQNAGKKEQQAAF